MKMKANKCRNQHVPHQFQFSTCQNCLFLRWSFLYRLELQTKQLSPEMWLWFLSLSLHCTAVPFINPSPVLTDFTATLSNVVTSPHFTFPICKLSYLIYPHILSSLCICLSDYWTLLHSRLYKKPPCSQFLSKLSLFPYTSTGTFVSLTFIL